MKQAIKKGESTMKEAYKHDYSGSYAPNKSTRERVDTFSVGCFQWLPKSNGKGLKKSAVKFRIRGYVSNPGPVYKMAETICDQLDRGLDLPTKSVFVKDE